LYIHAVSRTGVATHFACQAVRESRVCGCASAHRAARPCPQRSGRLISALPQEPQIASTGECTGAGACQRPSPGLRACRGAALAPAPPPAGQAVRAVRRSRGAARARRAATRVACLPDIEGNNSFTEELRATAKYISRRGFGILASDESNATTGKRLATVGAALTFLPIRPSVPEMASCGRLWAALSAASRHSTVGCSHAFVRVHGLASCLLRTLPCTLPALSNMPRRAFNCAGRHA